ncbi:hypothetical protein ACFL4E_03455, partial [Candidatus Omnitrophota bacterium]
DDYTYTNPTITIKGNLEFPSTGGYILYLQSGVSYNVEGNIAISEDYLVLNGATIRLTGSGIQEIDYTNGYMYTGYMIVDKPSGEVRVTSTNLDVARLYLYNGHFVAPTGTINVREYFYVTNGTFDANGGTVQFLANHGTTYVRAPDVHFYNVIFNKDNSGLLGGDPSAASIYIYDDFTVDNNLTIMNNDGGGGDHIYVYGIYLKYPVVTVEGDFIIPSTGGQYLYIGSEDSRYRVDYQVKGNVEIKENMLIWQQTYLRLIGEGLQEIDYTSGYFHTGYLFVDKPSGEVHVLSTNLDVARLYLYNGNFVAPTGTLTIRDYFYVTNGTFDANGGTVQMLANWSTTYIDTHLSANDVHFNNLILNKDNSGSTGGDTAARTLYIYGDFTVDGNLTIMNNDGGGGDHLSVYGMHMLFPVINVEGDFIIPSTGGQYLYIGSSDGRYRVDYRVKGNVSIQENNLIWQQTYLRLIGEGLQEIDYTSGYFHTGHLMIDKPSGEARVISTNLDAARLYIYRGHFVAPTGTTTVRDYFYITDGTFDANGGTVQFLANHETTYIDTHLSASDVHFYNVIFNKDNTGTLGEDTQAQTLYIYGDFTVDGNLTIMNNDGGGGDHLYVYGMHMLWPTVTVEGDFIIPSTSGQYLYMGTSDSRYQVDYQVKGNVSIQENNLIWQWTILRLVGESLQEIDYTSGYFHTGYLMIDKPAGEAHVISTNLDTARLYLYQGHLVAPAGTITVRDYFYVTNGTFDANGGTVKFLANHGTTYIDTHLSANAVHFYNVIFNKDNSGLLGGDTAGQTLYIYGDFTVDGDLTIYNSDSGGGDYLYVYGMHLLYPTITVEGNLTTPSTGGLYTYIGHSSNSKYNVTYAVKGDVTFSEDLMRWYYSTLNFIGTTTQNVTHTAGTFYRATWLVDDPSTYVMLQTNLTLGTTSSLYINEGTFDVNGYNLTVAGTFSYDATFRLEGGEVLSGVNFSDSQGTVHYDGDGSSGLASGVTYNNIEFSGESNWDLTEPLVVNGNLTTTTDVTLNQGDQDITTHGDVVLADGSFVADGTGVFNVQGDAFLDAGANDLGAVSIGASPDRITLVRDLRAKTLKIKGNDTLITLGYDVTVYNYIELEAGAVFDASRWPEMGNTKTITLAGEQVQITADDTKNTIIKVGGDWNNQGSFIADNSTVEFLGSDPAGTVVTLPDGSTKTVLIPETVTISGDNTFYNLECVLGPTESKTILFEKGKTQTIENELTISGRTGELVNLFSTDPGVKWYIDPQSVEVLVNDERIVKVSYVEVHDSENLQDTAIDPSEEPYESVGAAAIFNNKDWWTLNRITIQGKVYDSLGDAAVGEAITLFQNGYAAVPDPPEDYAGPELTETVVTNSEGYYTFHYIKVKIEPAAFDTMLVFVDGGSFKGNTVTVAAKQHIVGLDIYANTLSVTKEPGTWANTNAILQESILGSPGSLVFAMQGSEVDVDGNFRVLEGGSFNATGNFTVQGDWINEGSLTAPGTVTFDENSTTTDRTITPGGASFGNIILNDADSDWTIDGDLNATGSVTVTSANKITQDSNITIGGSLVVNAGTLDQDGGNLDIGGSLTMNGTALDLDGGTTTIGGNLILSAGTIDQDGGNITVEGSLNQAATTTFNSAAGAETDPLNLTVKGDFIVSDNALFNKPKGTLYLAGSETQLLDYNVAPELQPTAIHNLAHTGTGLVQLPASLAITGDFTNTAGTFDMNNVDFMVEGDTTISGGVVKTGTGTVTFGDTDEVLEDTVTISGGELQIESLNPNADLVRNLVSWTNSGGTINYCSETPTDTTLLSDMTAYRNLTIDSAGSIYTLHTNTAPAESDLTINGALNVNAGKLDTNLTEDHNITLKGNLDVSGELELNQNTIYFDGSTAITGGNLSFHNVEINGSLTSPLAGNINVTGDWTNNGTFNNEGGTVTLIGADQSISGDTTFFNLTKVSGDNDILTFEQGKTQTIEGTLTLKGTSSLNMLTLKSSEANEEWFINPVNPDTDKRIISYVQVEDSTNISEATIFVADESVSSGVRLVNWRFVTGVTKWAGTSTSWIDPANWTNGVPGGNDVAIIQTALAYPVLSGFTQLGDLVIEAGASLNLNGNTIAVDTIGELPLGTLGTFNNFGTLQLIGTEIITASQLPNDTDSGTVEYLGGSNLAYGAGGLGYTYNNLLLTGGTWSLGDELEVNGNLTIAGGASLKTNNNTISVGG